MDEEEEGKEGEEEKEEEEVIENLESNWGHKIRIDKSNYECLLLIKK